jgi:selenocysteine-specific elongation factor
LARARSAARAGALVRLADGVVLAPGALERAVEVLAGLTQPFTTSEARQALDTSRRVALPLLLALDQQGATQRLPDDRRAVRDR